MATERHLEQLPVPVDYQPPRAVSFDDYLRLSEDLPGKYDYHDGLIYPHFYPPGSHRTMAGGTVAHDQIIVRALTALSNHLGTRGPCQVYTSDMQLKAATHAYFPDVYVACGPTSPNQKVLEDAILVCEVRSQSTTDFDRGDKFEAYKYLPSLSEYLILDNRRAQAALLHKGDNGLWTYLVFSAGATIPLTSIGLNLPVDRLYEGVTLDPDPSRERS